MAMRTTKTPPIEKSKTTTRPSNYVFEMVLSKEFVKEEKRAVADHQNMLRRVILHIFVIDTAENLGFPRNFVTREMIKFRGLDNQCSDTYDAGGFVGYMPMGAPLRLKRRSEPIKPERGQSVMETRTRRNSWSPMSNLEAEREINVEKRRSIRYRGTKDG